jgi:hypothetical protein
MRQRICRSGMRHSPSIERKAERYLVSGARSSNAPRLRSPPSSSIDSVKQINGGEFGEEIGRRQHELSQDGIPCAETLQEN